MKNMIRAFVIALTLTGAAASQFSAQARENGTRLTVVKTSAFPIPSCPPDDPNACGMGGNGTN